MQCRFRESGTFFQFSFFFGGGARGPTSDFSWGGAEETLLLVNLYFVGKMGGGGEAKSTPTGRKTLTKIIPYYQENLLPFLITVFLLVLYFYQIFCRIFKKVFIKIKDTFYMQLQLS